MAAAVWDALEQEKNLIVEAGTGVGKSLAYLVPAAFWANKTGRRVIVSTYTRLLQTQLISQDIPLLSKLVPSCPSVGVAYGQENYLCLSRLHVHVTRQLFATQEETTEAEQLLNWAETTTDGVLVNYPFRLSSTLSLRVSRDSAACRGRHCPFFANCFYFRSRTAWENSNILIVNHALFFAHLASETELLPQADAVIIDEAHRLEEAAIRHFGAQVSQRFLTQLLDNLNPATDHGLIRHLSLPAQTRQRIALAVDHCQRELSGFFQQTAALIPPRSTRLRLTGMLPAAPVTALEHLAQLLSDLSQEADDEEVSAELKSVARRLTETGAALMHFHQQDLENEVQWIETQDSGHLVLWTAPLAVATSLAQSVYPAFSSVIMTSATLTVNQSFDFISGRLGLSGFRTLTLDSPFDFASRTLLYVPAHLPEPNEVQFIPRAAETIEKILKTSHGRALVLFTSYEMMRQVYNLISPNHYTLLVQGELPPGPLLERFRQDVHSVLLATQSFWQGVDVPGESLTCLIICRLPFDVPDEPRLMAICEKIKAEKGEPFSSYQLPIAVLRFRQGFGRLIRSQNDRGVVCVLDRRLLSRNYGSVFLNSLPPGIPLTRNLAEVAAFLAKSPSSHSGTAPNTHHQPRPADQNCL